MRFLLMLHVLAAVFIVGPLTFVTAVTPRVIRQGPDGLPALRLLRRTTRVYAIASLLVFLLGLAMVRHQYGYSFNQFWVSASITLFVVALGLILAVVERDQRKAVTSLEAGDAASVSAGRIAAASGTASLIWLAIIVLMVYRPGA